MHKITMHVLVDIFAHQGFAGIVSLQVNKTHEVKHAAQIPGNILDTKLSKAMHVYSLAFIECLFGYLGHRRSETLLDVPSETLSTGLPSAGGKILIPSAAILWSFVAHTARWSRPWSIS